MMVLVINNVYPDAKEPTCYVFVHEQVKALQNAGYKVIVLDIDLRSIRWKRRFGAYSDNYDGIIVYRISIPFITTKLRTIGRWINEIIGCIAAKIIFRQYGKADIIHAHFGFGAGNAGVAIKKKYGVPLVITEHSSKVLNANSINECKHSIAAYREADIVLSVGSLLAEKIRSLGIEKVYVLPNIIDSKKFCIQQRKSNDKYTFIAVGHLIPSKNHKDLINAFASINQYNQYRLVIIGRGTEKSKLLSQCAKLNCMESVEFIDSVPNDQLPKILNSVDCFVLPSLYETFGVVYAEAISCGIPAISYRNGGTNDIIDESLGIFTYENSWKALAEAMTEVQSIHYDPYQLHKSIEERFGINRYIREIGSIYRRLIRTEE